MLVEVIERKLFGIKGHYARFFFWIRRLLSQSDIRVILKMLMVENLYSFGVLIIGLADVDIVLKVGVKQEWRFFLLMSRYPTWGTDTSSIGNIQLFLGLSMILSWWGHSDLVEINIFVIFFGGRLDSVIKGVLSVPLTSVNLNFLLSLI